MVGRYESVRSMSEASAKATEQFDVDKKNGVLAYVPSDTSFDLQPLSGIIIRMNTYLVDKSIGLTNKIEKKEAINLEENKVTREVVPVIIYDIAITQTVGIGGKCN